MEYHTGFHGETGIPNWFSHLWCPFFRSQCCPCHFTMHPVMCSIPMKGGEGVLLVLLRTQLLPGRSWLYEALIVSCQKDSLSNIAPDRFCRFHSGICVFTSLFPRKCPLWPTWTQHCDIKFFCTLVHEAECTHFIFGFSLPLPFLITVAKPIKMTKPVLVFSNLK